MVKVTRQSVAPRLFPASDEKSCVACGEPLNQRDHWHTTPFPVESLCCGCARRLGYKCRVSEWEAQGR